MKEKILISIIILLGVTLGFTTYSKEKKFDDLNPNEKQQQIIAQRDQAIKEAQERGDYRCCIEPACTMCYMEANKWNYYQAGTCACDDFIAKGENPCPQCQQGEGNNASCDSVNNKNK